MLIALGGRVARAYFTETRGRYSPDWTMQSVRDGIDGVFQPEPRWQFTTLPDGMGRHLAESFAMVAAAWPR